jgi:glyoxylase-like metal-dependent hydrolase (beta-lactamase superfamily II)
MLDEIRSRNKGEAMARKIWSALIGLALVAGVASAQDAKTVLQNATKAMGDVKSIQYSGTGHLSQVGQAWNPNSPWPETIVKSYTKTIDYGSQSAREELVRNEGDPPAKGGAAPFGGDQRQVNVVSGQYAWNQPGNAPVPQVAAAEERQLQIWLTPHGFLNGAMQNNATAKKGKGGTEVSFTAMGKFKVTGTIDSQGMVTKTEARVSNPVLGDMLVETDYSGYKDFGGVKFPSTIVQNQGGHPLLDLAITDVKTNVPLSLPVPDNVKSAKLPPVMVTSQKLGDGLWWLGGGSHNSVVVEYPAYITVIESPLNEERALAVIAEAKKLVPNKPIKYLVNTHNHFDHTGGVRTFIAEGATVITNAMNKPYYEQIFKAPHTMDPDELSKSPKKATYITVKERYVLSDGGREIDIHHMENDNHNEGMLIVYIPKEKVLVEADEFTPPAPNGPPPAPRALAFTKNLNANIERLKLDIVTIAPLHGVVVPIAELKKWAATT